LTWTGANAFEAQDAGAFGLMTYIAEVKTQGNFQLQLRSFHGNVNVSEATNVHNKVRFELATLFSFTKELIPSSGF
jgi:hypothetical protein